MTAKIISFPSRSHADADPLLAKFIEAVKAANQNVEAVHLKIAGDIERVCKGSDTAFLERPIADSIRATQEYILEALNNPENREIVITAIVELGGGTCSTFPVAADPKGSLKRKAEGWLANLSCAIGEAVEGLPGADRVDAEELSHHIDLAFKSVNTAAKQLHDRLPAA